MSSSGNLEKSSDKAQIAGAEETANKDVANGYMGLDSSSVGTKLPKLHTDSSHSDGPNAKVSSLGSAASANKVAAGQTGVLDATDATTTNTRTPTDGSVTDAKVASNAAIAESKLNLASDAAAGTASRRTLGSGATQAAQGSLTEYVANKGSASGYMGLDSNSRGTSAPKTHDHSAAGDQGGTLSVYGNAGMFKIAESDVGGSPPTNFDIQSIPATYQHLYVVASLRSDVAGTSDGIFIAFNNDSTNANYDREYIQAVGSTASASEGLTARTGAAAVGASASAGLTASFEMMIPNYSLTTLFKVARITSMAWTLRTAGGIFVREIILGWASTAAINRLTLTPTGGTHWAAGSTISVYGMLPGA